MPRKGLVRTPLHLRRAAIRYERGLHSWTIPLDCTELSLSQPPPLWITSANPSTALASPFTPARDAIAPVHATSAKVSLSLARLRSFSDALTAALQDGSHLLNFRAPERKQMGLAPIGWRRRGPVSRFDKVCPARAPLPTPLHPNPSLLHTTR